MKSRILPLLMNNQAGFTLIEIIMSILILAIVSIFVLQMFIKADILKQKTIDKDFALNTAQSALEHFRNAGSNPNSLIADFETSPKLLNYIDDNNYELECYFDKNWQPLLEKSSIGYTLTLRISSDSDPSLVGRLLQAEVVIIRHHPYLLTKEHDVKLCNLHSLVYMNNSSPERN